MVDAEEGNPIGRLPMNATQQLTESFQAALRTTGGLVEVVDAVLRVCHQERLHIRWHPDCCQISSLSGSLEDEIAKPLPISQFRAVLARIAAICNEHLPGCVTPYGGHAYLPLESDRKMLVRVIFANTADEQLLDIRPARRSNGSRIKRISEKLRPISLRLREAQKKIEELERRVEKANSDADRGSVAGRDSVSGQAANDPVNVLKSTHEHNRRSPGETNVNLGATSIFRGSENEPIDESVSAVATRWVTQAVATMTAQQFADLKRESTETKSQCAELIAQFAVAMKLVEAETKRLKQRQATIITIVCAAISAVIAYGILQWLTT